MADTNEAKALAHDIKAAVNDLAEGACYPDLIAAIDRLAALAQQAAPQARPSEPLKTIAAIRKLALADLDAMSDDEIRNEIKGDGHDPDALAQDIANTLAKEIAHEDKSKHP